MKSSNLISLLSDMIAIPSVNPMGLGHTGVEYSEEDLVCYIKQRLERIGLDVQLYYPSPEHPCIIGRCDVGAPETLLLDAHLDTVSHKGMDISPFDPVCKEGRVYGRGACDTKGSMAVYLAALENILGAGKKLQKNVIIVGCSDEEFSFSGIEFLKSQNLKADYALIGEPTQLQGLHSHKGVLRCYIRAEGEACHSSTPERGRNAIYLLCRAVQKLEAYHLSLASRVHPILGAPTLSVGVISGGTTVNTVPAAAWVDVDRRLVPGEEPEQVLEEIQKAVADLDGISVESPYVRSSGFHENTSSSACSLLSHHCARHNHTLGFTTASFGTHAPHYQELGIPSVVFGPGSITQAHTACEYVEVSQVESAYEILKSILCSE